MEEAHARSTQRLSNYSAALMGLREAVELHDGRGLSELEKAGMVQRFEIAWELGWKLLSDILAEELVPPESLTPGAVIRASLAAGLIADGEDWMAMGKLRNQLSHTYNQAIRDEGLGLIASRFLPVLDALALECASRGDG